jgi:hypothetical protein
MMECGLNMNMDKMVAMKILSNLDTSVSINVSDTMIQKVN